jgi:hypothetical protein
MVLGFLVAYSGVVGFVRLENTPYRRKPEQVYRVNHNLVLVRGSDMSCLSS